MGSRIRFTKAKQVFETYPELSETVSEPGGDVAPEDYTIELQDSEEPNTAIEYFAHVLPKREAVWWAMNCVKGLENVTSEHDREILKLSENWVREGDEEARAAVHAAAEAAKSDSASVWVGFAAGWSGGSLSPNPEYRVEMPDHLTAKAVNAAVLIALGKLLPDEREQALRSCLSAGLSFAGGDTMPVVRVKSSASAV